MGDHVFFYAGKRFIAHARIAHLMDNVELAQSVWGVDDDVHTWQHMMALTEIEHRVAPSAPLLQPLGHNEVLRSLTLLPQDESDRFLAPGGTAMMPRPLRVGSGEAANRCR